MNKPNWIIGVLILMLPAIFVMEYTAVPYPFYPDDVAVLKIAFQHTGQRVIEYDEIGSLKKRAEEYRKSLKDKRQVRMSLKSQQSTTRERFPVAITLFVDNKKILDNEFPPTGRAKDMASCIYGAFELKPGMHHVKVVMTDSKKEGVESIIFEDTVEFKQREVKVVTFDKPTRTLSWSKNLTPVADRPEYKDDKNR